MKKALLIILTLIATAACKQQQPLSAVPMPGNAAYGGMTIPKERNYNDAELLIVRRICGALESKRTLFEQQADQVQQIKFKGENRSCDSGIIYNAAEFVVKLSTASSTNLQYVAFSRTNYLSEVITDKAGAMGIICERQAVSDAVSNTILSGSSYLTVNALISSGFDRIEISKRTKNASGDYPIVSIEGINIYTQSNQINSKFFGAEQERIRYTTCPDQKSSSYIKQNWVTALTGF